MRKSLSAVPGAASFFAQASSEVEDFLKTLAAWRAERTPDWLPTQHRPDGEHGLALRWQRLADRYHAQELSP